MTLKYFFNMFGYLRILTGKKAPSNKTSALIKSTNKVCWYIKSTLYKKFLNWNKIFIRVKQLLAKLPYLWKAYFVVTVPFVLTLASDMAVLNGNDALSILVLSTKNRYSSFLKQSFRFPENLVNVKVLKTLKIFNDCHIKIYRSLKRRAILKIHGSGF